MASESSTHICTKLLRLAACCCCVLHVTNTSPALCGVPSTLVLNSSADISLCVHAPRVHHHELNGITRIRITFVSVALSLANAADLFDPLLWCQNGISSCAALASSRMSTSLADFFVFGFVSHTDAGHCILFTAVLCSCSVLPSWDLCTVVACSHPSGASVLSSCELHVPLHTLSADIAAWSTTQSPVDLPNSPGGPLPHSNLVASLVAALTSSHNFPRPWHVRTLFMLWQTSLTFRFCHILIPKSTRDLQPL